MQLTRIYLIFLVLAVSSIYGNHTLDSGKSSSSPSTASSSSSNSSSNVPTLTLSPDETMSHFVNQSRMVGCTSSDPDVKLRWRNPKNAIIADAKGRVHVEQFSGASLMLIFEAIVRSDQGNWTCETDTEGGKPVRKKSFKMIVNGKREGGRLKVF